MYVQLAVVDSRPDVISNGVMYIVSNGLWWIPGQMWGSVCPTSCVDSRPDVSSDGVMYIVSYKLWWIPGQMWGSVCPTSCGGFQARCDIGWG